MRAAVLGLCAAVAAAGSLNDVQNIVIFMQENRAYDVRDHPAGAGVGPLSRPRLGRGGASGGALPHHRCFFRDHRRAPGVRARPACVIALPQLRGGVCAAHLACRVRGGRPRPLRVRERGRWRLASR
jgi:hypothetical protein